MKFCNILLAVPVLFGAAVSAVPQGQLFCLVTLTLTSTSTQTSTSTITATSTSTSVATSTTTVSVATTTSTVTETSSVTSTVTSFVPPPPPICGIQGEYNPVSLAALFLIGTPSRPGSGEGCLQACVNTPGCWSAVLVSGSSCFLYGTPAANIFGSANNLFDNVFYDRSCAA